MAIQVGKGKTVYGKKSLTGSLVTFSSGTAVCEILDICSSTLRDALGREDIFIHGSGMLLSYNKDSILNKAKWTIGELYQYGTFEAIATTSDETSIVGNTLREVGNHSFIPYSGSYIDKRIRANGGKAVKGWTFYIKLHGTVIPAPCFRPSDRRRINKTGQTYRVLDMYNNVELTFEKQEDVSAEISTSVSTISRYTSAFDGECLNGRWRMTCDPAKELSPYIYISEVSGPCEVGIVKDDKYIAKGYSISKAHHQLRRKEWKDVANPKDGHIEWAASLMELGADVLILLGNSIFHVQEDGLLLRKPGITIEDWTLSSGIPNKYPVPNFKV